jgi:hypothetical protein
VFENYAGNIDQFDDEIMNQIDYIMYIINKSGGSVYNIDIFDII